VSVPFLWGGKLRPSAKSEGGELQSDRKRNLTFHREGFNLEPGEGKAHKGRRSAQQKTEERSS